MTEGSTVTQNPVESFPQTHQDVVTSFRKKVEAISQVTKIEAASLDNGQHLIIVSTVKTNSQSVWNRLWDIEYDVHHQFEGTVINFLVLDANQGHGPTDLDPYISKGVEFSSVFER